MREKTHDAQEKESSLNFIRANCVQLRFEGSLQKNPEIAAPRPQRDIYMQSALSAPEMEQSADAFKGKNFKNAPTSLLYRINVTRYPYRLLKTSLEYDVKPNNGLQIQSNQ